MMRVLGVDGGQSATRLRDSSGRAAEAQGVSRLEGDPVDGLLGAVAAAWRAGGFSPVDRVVLGLTTAPGDPTAAARLCAPVALLTGASEVWLADDAVTAHAGALSLGWGISVIAGTGVACLALPERGVPRILGGHGYLLGDEGGGFWIGRRALSAVLRAREGRELPGQLGETSPLAAAAERRFGALAEVPVRIHGVARPVHAIAAFAEEVLASDGVDPVATRILDEATAELVLLVGAALRTAAPDGAVAPLGLGGRLLAEGSGLWNRLHAELDRVHLSVAPRAADGTPVDGALALGLRGDPGRYGALVYRWGNEVPV
jgi:N-acetylglucosamine kinase-like BadF-type ATPase